MTLNPDQFWGKGLEALFPEGSSPKTTAPFPRAARTKQRFDYDEAPVHKKLNEPPQLEEVDPRSLHVTQPHVTRAGVAYYMQGGQYERSGRTFADQEQAGNRFPMVYDREASEDVPEQHMLLAGTHRATAALLEGRPLRSLRTGGAWGRERRQT